jgi:hypothetical protein
MFKRILLIIIFALLVRSAAEACDICATYVALAGRESAGRTTISLYELYSQYDRPSGGGHKFESYTTQFAAGYWLTDRWAAQLGVPYVYRKLNDQSESGIGDATLILLHRAVDRFVEDNLYRIDVYGGVKMPTGDSDLLRDEREALAHGDGGSMHRHAGHTHDHSAPATAHGHEADGGGHAVGHHLAPGSGSWDGIVGVKGLVKQGRWLGLAETQYNLRTKGDHGFRHGDEWSWRVGAHYYAWLTEERSWTLGVDVSGEWRDENRVDGQKREGSDKSGVYVGPATGFTWGDRLHLAAAYDIPVSERNKGLSGAADRRARVSLAWSF